MLQNSLIIADQRLEFIERGLEATFRGFKRLPHYQFLLIPIYKFCAARVGNAAAAALTFLAGDLLLHQALGSFINCYFMPEGFCQFEIRWQITLIWCVVMAFPVVYVKFKREKLSVAF
ncbi:MAG: hypothetical protein ACK5MA_01410 [Parachlamydiaceae bacterium]